MLEFFWYDGRKRIRESIYLAVALSLLAALVIWVYPSFSEGFEDVDEFLEIYPEEILRVFNIQTMDSLEGFLAFELYVFGWVIMLGLYVAYSAAGIIADDVERGRVDSLLAMPISRTRLLVERFAALIVPLLVVNLVVPVVVLAGGWLIEEPLSVLDVVALHALSIPYLFACAGIGVLCSVIFDRVGIAQRVALAGTFGLFLLESLLTETDYEEVGALAPMRYYDPNEVLLDSTYDPVNTAVLVGMTGVLVVISIQVFLRKDV